MLERRRRALADASLLSAAYALVTAHNAHKWCGRLYAEREDEFRARVDEAASSIRKAADFSRRKALPAGVRSFPMRASSTGE